MGIAVTDRITRGTDNSSAFAVAWEDDLKLSHVNCANIGSRDAIPEWKRLPFMEAYIISEDKTYRLGADTTIAGQNWTDITPGVVPANIVTQEELFDSEGYIYSSLIRNVFVTDTYTAASEAAMLALTTVIGNLVIRTDTAAVYVKLNNDDPSGLEDFAELTYPGTVLSVNGDVGVVVITLADLISADVAGFNAAVANTPAVLGLDGAVAGLVLDIDDLTTTVNGLILDVGNKADLDGGVVPDTQLPDYQVPIAFYDEGTLIGTNLVGVNIKGSGVETSVVDNVLQIFISGGGGGGGAGVWGAITGTLSDQADLNSALNGKVATTRQLTINGVAQDLSADRTWDVGDVLTSGSYANPTWITSLAWGKISGTPTTIAGYGITDPIVLTSGSYSNPSWITSLDAAKITTGILPLSVIPAAALERVYIYGGIQTLPENAGLTTTEVQNGDVVKMNTTGLMYIVTNDAALNNAASYVVYNAGTAASVPWSGVTGTPTTLAGYGISDAVINTRQLTINGTAGRITSSAGAQSLAADRTWTLDLATAGTAGTYRSVTTDAYGRVTAGTNPTTLAGYGITDAWNEGSGAVLTANNTISGAFNVGFTNTAFGIGMAPASIAASTKMHLMGAGTSSSTYALKVENSFGDDLFFIRDDGRISLGRDVDTNYREIIKSVGNASNTYGFGVFNSSDLLLGRFRDDQVFELGGDAAFITVTAGVAAGDAAIQFLPYTTGSGLAYRFQDTNLVDFMRFFNQTTTMRREVVMAQPVTYSYGSGEERQTKQYQIDSDGVANSENVVFEFTLADAEHYDIKVLHADAVADDGTSITTTAIDYADVYKEVSVNIQGNTGITTLSRIKTSDGVFNWNLDTTNQKIQYRFKSNTTGTKVFRIFVDITLVKRITPVFE